MLNNLLFFYIFIDILGEKKLTKLSNPDVWKQGSRNTIGGNDGGVKINENKLLSKKKATLK